jgi:hypothetical protein
MAHDCPFFNKNPGGPDHLDRFGDHFRDAAPAYDFEIIPEGKIIEFGYMPGIFNLLKGWGNAPSLNFPS